MLVSIIISAYNEEKYLPILFDDIVEQTYDKKNIEVVLVNAMSKDKTKNIMENFKNTFSKEFNNIVIVDNPKKSQPSGFNLAIKNSSGDVILKIDAHSRVEKNFVEKSLDTILEGEYVCGGSRPTIIEGNSSWKKTLHLLEENMFGSSISNFRTGTKSKYVSSVFHGMYRREVFEKSGLADEQLIRTEDNELHYRITKAGYKIKYNPEIKSYQYIRPTLQKMLKQKYSNGYWIGLTTHVCKDCLSIKYFIPLLFLISVIFSLFMTIWTPIFIIGLLTIYLSLILLVSAFSIYSSDFKFSHLSLPLLMFLVHISYGIGTLVGLVKGFSWKKHYYKNRKIEYK